MNPVHIIRLIMALHASAIPAQSQETLDVTKFGARADGSDTTPVVSAALEEIGRSKVAKLVFPPGRYDFWPDHAAEKYLFVSNNDEGLKRIAFPLENVRDLTIEGRGATFIFHGPMVPFLVDGCQRITLDGFSFDFVRPFHSEGEVTAITPETVDLRIAGEFPYEVRNGILVFTGGKKPAGTETTVASGEVIYPYTSLLAFDPVKREPAFMAKDRYSVGAGIVARALGPQEVRLTLGEVSATPGDILVFGAPRGYPGIIISDSSGVSLDAVNIHHCGGMGLIAQRSADLKLHKVRVTPAPGSKRVVSLPADATHFVNCRGKIELVDCLFEQQKDDATNIHGLYARISRIQAPDRIEVQMIHPQQAGIDFVKPGTRLELTHGPSLVTIGAAVAKSVKRLNKETTIIETEQPLPQELKVGDAIADADANTAEVLVRNCVIRGNRARGILLGSRGRTVVEGNTFHSPGAAILFEGDASFWFEQAGVTEAIIRGNTFDNCNYGVWGTACIQVGSGIAKDFRKTSRYNRNVVIEDNLFRVFSPLPLLSMYSVDGLEFRNNRMEASSAYPVPPDVKRKNFEISDCDRVEVQEPVSAGPSTSTK